MVKLFKLHKFFGLSAGLVLLILGVTGFFIDHKQWSFLYTTTFKNVPNSTYTEDKKLFEAYYVDSEDTEHIIVGGKRGIYETFDEGETYTKMSNLQCLALRNDDTGIYAATSDGIYKLQNNKWNLFALKGKYINSLAISKNYIVVSVDKHNLVTLRKDNAIIISDTIVEIKKEKLKDDIKLSRFVRDLHYGRGLLDGDLSLYINDFGTIILSFLAISGYFIWWFIHKKKKAKISRKLIRWHANSFAVVSLIPLLILTVTGIFLDHSGGLKKFMSSTTIPNEVLPPVYSSLKHDIWSVDFDGNTYRIGNRYGVYKSKDLKNWTQDSKGLAFRMIRLNDVLYVSGMGSANRIYDGEWKYLGGAPFMFRDVYNYDDEVKFFTYRKYEGSMPEFENATLYSVLLTMHGGVFFASWWKWINDFVSFGLLILGITGTIRWYHKKKLLIKK